MLPSAIPACFSRSGISSFGRSVAAGSVTVRPTGTFSAGLSSDAVRDVGFGASEGLLLVDGCTELPADGAGSDVVRAGLDPTDPL